MAEDRVKIQFWLDRNSEDLLVNEARSRKISTNQAASYLVKKALRDGGRKDETLLRLSATTNYVLANFIVALMKKLDPEITEEKLINKLNEDIFTPSRISTDELLKRLGVED